MVALSEVASGMRLGRLAFGIAWEAYAASAFVVHMGLAVLNGVTTWYYG